MNLHDYFERNEVSTFDEMIESLRLEFAPKEKTGVNDFGENEEILYPGDYVYSAVSDCARDVQLNPYKDEPKVDRCLIQDIRSVENRDYFIATVSGGANGSGDFEDYLMVIRKFAHLISERLKTHVWLIDWKNDCADDVWTLRIGFKDGVNKDADATDGGIDEVATEDVAKQLCDDKGRREKALDVMLGVLRDEVSGNASGDVVAEDADYSHLNLEKHDKRFHGGRFDEKTMTCKLRDDLSKADNPDAALAEHETKMAGLSGKKVEEYARLLGKKRKDLDPEETLLKIAEIKDQKLQGDAFLWLLKGAVRLPEDLSKVRDAREYATRAKKDPFSYETPQACVNDLAAFKPKEKAIDPDTVPELSDKKVLPMGVTTYLVQDDKKGQAAMRRIIDTHWGKDANPWCLLAREDDEEREDQDADDASMRNAWNYWNHYNAKPKRVAFKDGKLLAFMATDGDGDSVQEAYNNGDMEEYEDEFYAEEDDDWGIAGVPHFEEWFRKKHPKEYLEFFKDQWWDRNDEPHEGIPIGRIPVEGDELGRERNVELKDGKAEYKGKFYKGKVGKPGYQEWFSDGGKEREIIQDGTEISWEGDGDVYSISTSEFPGWVAYYPNGNIRLIRITDPKRSGWISFDEEGNVKEQSGGAEEMGEELVELVYSGKYQKMFEDYRITNRDKEINLREVADAAIRESELVEVEDAAKQLDKLKQLCRMGKISKAEFKTGLAGLYAAGLITMNQFDVAKRQFR